MISFILGTIIEHYEDDEVSFEACEGVKHGKVSFAKAKARSLFFLRQHPGFEKRENQIWNRGNGILSIRWIKRVEDAYYHDTVAVKALCPD